MPSNEKYKNYCIGCGLCKSEFNCKKYKENGFICYSLDTVDDKFLKNVCPISGNIDKNYNDNPFGKYEKVYYGWSTDKSIRYKASSGGVITSLAIFLLEKKFVDGIIQIKRKEENPIETEVVISRNKKEVINCVGSRYCNSSVLEYLSDLIDSKKKYALIGRPCDISTFKNYQNLYNKYENIIYTIAFFCAGNPSDNANIKLINDMGLNDFSKCKNMNYRGNGWPGYATVTDINNKDYKMRYNESWGYYLGRDIRLMCKFCIDGCGSTADISCGDGWYLDKNGSPIFDENEGRNLIFARNSKGLNLIETANSDNYIELSNCDNDLVLLKKIQPAQYLRTTTMFSKINVFKLFHRNVPSYDKRILKKLSKYNSLKSHFRIFIGTFKRIINKKI